MMSKVLPSISFRRVPPTVPCSGCCLAARRARGALRPCRLFLDFLYLAQGLYRQSSAAYSVRISAAVAERPRIAKCRFSTRPAEPALGALSPDAVTAFRRALEQPAPRRESVSHIVGNEGTENGA